MIMITIIDLKSHFSKLFNEGPPSMVVSEDIIESLRSLDALPGKGWEEKAAAVGLWAAFAVDGGGGGTDGRKQKMEWKIPSGQKIRGEGRRRRGDRVGQDGWRE